MMRLNYWLVGQWDLVYVHTYFSSFSLNWSANFWRRLPSLWRRWLWYWTVLKVFFSMCSEQNRYTSLTILPILLRWFLKRPWLVNKALMVLSYLSLRSTRDLIIVTQKVINYFCLRLRMWNEFFDQVPAVGGELLRGFG